MGYWSHQFKDNYEALDYNRVDEGLDRPVVAPLSVVRRRHIVPQAAGDVLEIGIGSGSNLSYYKPGQVKKVTGVDPRANVPAIQEKATRYGLPVTVLQQDVEAVILDDEVADCVVSTYTLCAVKDPEAVLLEVGRLLRPGGRLLFCERGRHPRGEIACMQDLFSPVWSCLSKGCRLNRNMFRLIERAGLRIDFLETGAEPFRPSVFGYVYTGSAIKS